MSAFAGQRRVGTRSRACAATPTGLRADPTAFTCPQATGTRWCRQVLRVHGCDSTVTKALSKYWLFCLVGGFILCERCFALYFFSSELKLLPFPELLCVCPVNHCRAGGTRKCFPAVARALGYRLGTEGPRPKQGEGGRFAQPRQRRPPGAEPAGGRGTSHPRGCPQERQAPMG